MADFDPNKFLGNTPDDEKKKEASSSFDPDKFLNSNNEKPKKGFDPNNFLKSEPIKQTTGVLKNAGKGDMEAALPEIPKDTTRVSPSYLKDVVERYEAQGKDSGMEVINFKNDKGADDFVVRKKATIGALTGDEIQPRAQNWAERGISWFMGDWYLGEKRSTEIQLSNINKQLDNQAKRNVFGDTNTAKQFLTGFLAPNAELAAGASSFVMGGAPSDYLEDTSTEYGRNYKFKWDELTATEKAGYLIGNVLGYILPGSMFKSVSEGAVGVVTKQAAKSTLIKNSYKATGKFVSEKLLTKVPPETAAKIAKSVVGRYTGKFIKNAPALATEGFLWNTIASGGDVKAGLEGAITFPILGTALEMGVEGASQFVKNTLKGGGEPKATPKPASSVMAPKPTMEQPTTQAQMTAPQGKPQASPMASPMASPTAKPTALPPPAKPTQSITEPEVVGVGSQKMQPLFNKEQDTIMDKVLSNEDNMNKFMLTTVQPPGFDSSTFIKGKALSAIVWTARKQADAIEKASIINKKIGALENVSKKLDSKIEVFNNKIKANMDKFMQKAAKMEDNPFYFKEKPKNIDQLKVSYQTKELLQDRFGKDVNNIFQAAGSGNKIDVAKTLHQSGFSAKTSIKIADQLTDTMPVLRKKTDIVKQIKLGEDQRLILSDTKRLMKEMGKLQTKKSDFVDQKLLENYASPDFIKEADPYFFKTKSKEQYVMDEVYKLANESGFDLSGFKWKERYEWTAQTEKWNNVQKESGIPINIVLSEAHAGVQKKGHFERIMYESTKWPEVLQELQSLKPKGETLDSYGLKMFKNLHYVEQAPDGTIRWNPNPSGNQIGAVGKSKGIRKSYPVPPFEGPMPSAKELELLFKLREGTGVLFGIAETNGVKMPEFISNYVAIKRKIGSSPKTAPTTLYKKTKIRETGITKERHWGTVPESRLHEYDTNIFTLYPRIVKDGIDEAALGQFKENAKVVDFMLRASKNNDQTAENFRKYIQRAMGMKGPQNQVQARAEKMALHMAESSVKDNSHWLDHFSKVGAYIKKKYNVGAFNNEDMISLARDVYNTGTEMMYKSWLGLSKYLPLKQAIQPLQMAAPEVTMKNVLAAEAMVAAHDGTNYLFANNFLSKKLGIKNPLKNITLPKEYQEAWKRMETSIVPEDATNRYGLPKPKRWWLQAISDFSSIPAKPGLKVFEIEEKFNRKVSFVAGLMHFDQAAKKGAFKSIFGDLLEIERAMMSEAFEKGGMKMARDQYGMIRAKRANFFYNMTDKPDAFSEGFGKYIPFTTWGVNQWARYIENFKGLADKGNRFKNASTLGKRLGYAFSTVMALQYLMNEKFYAEKADLGFAGEFEVNSAASIPGISIFTSSDGLTPFTVLRGVADGTIVGWVNAAKTFFPNKKKKEKMEKRRASYTSEDLLQVFKWTSPATKGLKKKEKTTKTLFPGFQYTTPK